MTLLLYVRWKAGVYEERILACVRQRGWLRNGARRVARGAMQQPAAASWPVHHNYITYLLSPFPAFS